MWSTYEKANKISIRAAAFLRAKTRPPLFGSKQIAPAISQMCWVLSQLQQVVSGAIVPGARSWMEV